MKKIESTLKRIKDVTKRFDTRCHEFEVIHGHQTSLTLGWGITRGTVNHLITDNDYIGADINKAARLCAIARPYGIVIDKFDFTAIPQVEGFSFHEQKRLIPDIDDDAIDVWVTDEIYRAFHKREDMRESPEVHVAGYCIKSEGGKTYILISRRSSERALYPGKLEGCGGQLRADETFTQGIERHYRTEMGISVKPMDFHYLYVIEETGTPYIPGICFLCEYVDGEPSSSNHTDHRWVTLQQLREISVSEFIGDTRKQLERLVKEYDEKNKHRSKTPPRKTER